MKNLKIYLLALLAFAFVIQSCDEDVDLILQQEIENPLPGEVTGTPGSLDLSNYVSIGNSIAAGFQDGALYTDAQNQSFATFLGTQFQVTGVGGQAFNVPSINSVNGLSGANPAGGFFGRFELSLSQLRPVPTEGELFGAFDGDNSALNNFAVPGMKVTDISLPSLAGSNQLYGRFASSPGTSTVLGDALATDPTFFTYELGSNDVLGYATSGGANIADITDAVSFQTSLQTSLSALVASGAKGVVMNVPMMLTAPFFRAVPYNAVPLDAATAQALNAGFAGFNQALAGMVQATLITQADMDQRMVAYQAGANPILIFDESLEDLGPKFDLLGLPAAARAGLEPFRQSRPAVATDLPLLTAATEIGRDVTGTGTVLSGISLPIADNFILTQAEQVDVITARVTYNTIISNVIQAINAAEGSTVLAEYDINVQLADIAGLNTATATQLGLSAEAIAAADGTLGIIVDGVSLAPDFSPNGVFSTDGIHPNPRGHGIVANAMIQLMNDTFGSTIPLMNVLALRGIIATD
ncbi:SGNH/GDSL hydrolase family protein [Roseivirga misakiensis]|uniref:G-D-S-L family lipolytic protein n=1 Tax=Roseivirga misakiensis TaxID=1563681 RepID=A0A1E5T111_9BACT|nr:SGNH/GDSL hydrolase family protein [Roseivirga misakiensis]OEK04997.1 hypothetical protein BFP71_16355 [Roseivirga misakiensis]